MRPTDWQPLAAADPVPGDPEALAGLVDDLADVAAAVREQRGRLDRIDTSDLWDSDAARSFVELRADVPPDLERIATRYDDVAHALASYHPALAEAQRAADVALVRAREAEADLERARHGVDEMHAWAISEEIAAADRGAECGVPVDPAPWPGADHEAHAVEAEQRLDAERAALADIVEALHEAAERAAQVIAQAIDDDLRDPGGFRGWVQSNADTLGALSEVLGTLSAGIGVIAIFVPVLAPVSFALDATAFGLDLGMALGGEGEISAVLMSGAGLLVGGVGRGLGAADGAARAGASVDALGDLGRAGAVASSSADLADGARRAGGLGQAWQAVRPQTLVAEFGAGVGSLRSQGLAAHVGSGLAGLAAPVRSGRVAASAVQGLDLGLTGAAAYDRFAGKQVTLSIGGGTGLAGLDVQAGLRTPSLGDPTLAFEGAVHVRAGSHGVGIGGREVLEPVAVPPVPAAAGVP